MPAHARAIMDGARRAVLSTIAPSGRAHSVPVCFAVRANQLISPIDHKPKSGRLLARVRNIESNPNATLLFDRWDEDWTKLGWVMISGAAQLERSPRGDDVLRDRYIQFRDFPPFDALIVVAPERIVWWTWTEPGA